MKLLCRSEQNKVYKELVELLKSIIKLEDGEFFDSFRAIEKIAVIVGGPEMRSKFEIKPGEQLLIKIRDEIKK